MLIPPTTIILPDVSDEKLQNCLMILVVDDEQQIRSLLSNILGTNGYIVLTTATAEAALDLISSFRDRLTAVVTDIHLQPGRMNGISLCRRVREFSPDLEILAVSGAFTDQIVDDLDSLGVRTLTKPFRISDLLTVLKAFEDAPKNLLNAH